MKPQVANPSLADVMDERTVVGSPVLCHEEDGRIRCVACGHRCLIGEGQRGICKVRFNEAGELKVPFGYVAGFQCDPVEKKPFFHVYPGSDALTFGMLGCDLHCSYCFPGDTHVVTNRGPIRFFGCFRQRDAQDRHRRRGHLLPRWALRGSRFGGVPCDPSGIQASVWRPPGGPSSSRPAGAALHS